VLGGLHASDDEPLRAEALHSFLHFYTTQPRLDTDQVKFAAPPPHRQTCSGGQRANMQHAPTADRRHASCIAGRQHAAYNLQRHATKPCNNNDRHATSDHLQHSFSALLHSRSPRSAAQPAVPSRAQLQPIQHRAALCTCPPAPVRSHTAGHEVHSQEAPPHKRERTNARRARERAPPRWLAGRQDVPRMLCGDTLHAMHGVCCTLSVVACCMFHAAYRLVLHVACCMLHIAWCCMLHVAWHTWLAARETFGYAWP
jgi:hypothetical protein